jgi:hypothetical protein
MTVSVENEIAFTNAIRDRHGFSAKTTEKTLGVPSRIRIIELGIVDGGLTARTDTGRDSGWTTEIGGDGKFGERDGMGEKLGHDRGFETDDTTRSIEKGDISKVCGGSNGRSFASIDRGDFGERWCLQ